MSESRPLSELTRQITPPTKNGHAPPPTESRKSSQSVNPRCVRAGWDSPCWVKLSRRLHSWWCPSVNSFKFQLCNHTSPGTQRLWFPGGCRAGLQKQTPPDRQSASFTVRTRTVSDRLRTSDFRSWSRKTFLANAFAVVRLAPVQEFHLWRHSTDAPVRLSRSLPRAFKNQQKQDRGPLSLFRAPIFRLPGPALNTLIFSK